MMKKLTLALLLSISVEGFAAETKRIGSLEFEKCMAEGERSVYPALCATLAVPENHDQPEGSTVDLALTWIPPRSDSADSIPLVFLAGGPGQGARASFPSIRSGLSRVGEFAPILLVDQRGTGESQALDCPFSEEDVAVLDANDRELAQRLARDCMERHAGRALAHYTTDDAAMDLELVRQVLGLNALNVAGVSYGTRLAQRYAALYPDQTRSLVLDSPVPSNLVLLSEHGRNLDFAISARLSACSENPECYANLGDTRLLLDELLNQLSHSPIETRYRHPRTGEYLTTSVGQNHLISVFRMLSYQPSTAVMLPTLVANAKRDGFADILALNHIVVESMQESISHGLQLSVICSESIPFLAQADVEAEADTLLGAQLIEFSRSQCEGWPQKAVLEDFHSLAAHDIPTLVVTGELDPVTPPRYGDVIAAGLTNAQHITVKGEGHSVLNVGCLPRLVADFVETLKFQETECIDNRESLPVFTGVYGWEP